MYSMFIFDETGFVRKINNKVVLVTASTRGIGLAIVKKCAEEGAKVYMAARDMERAQEIANTLNGVKCVYNDATKPETFTTMVEDVVRDAGRIDVLVNNFGTSNPGKDLDFANTDPEVFLNTVTLNLRSVFLASQAAVRHMRRYTDFRWEQGRRRKHDSGTEQKYKT